MHQSSTRNAADGTALNVLDWPLAKGNPHGVVIFHGLGEHALRHARLARFFLEHGYAVRAFDWRGHGASGGPRGDVPHPTVMMEDAKPLIDEFTDHLGAPPLLFGHSMGGLFAARFACEKRSPLRGLMLSSPALSIPLSGLQHALLRALRRLAPGWGAPNGLQSRYLSHDPAIVAAYRRDPLVHGVISARLLDAMLDAIAICQEQASSLMLPVLLQVAGADRIVDARGSKRFFQQLAADIGTWHCYEDAYHEIFNEDMFRHARALGDAQMWLKHLESGKNRTQTSSSTFPA